MKLTESVIKIKSRAFAIRIIKLYQFLQNEKKEYVMSKQVLRSGTSIGANVHEAFFGASKKDFTNKLSIALKEACETEYWLDILAETNYIDVSMKNSILADCQALCKLLHASVKTAKASNN